jgi:Xaa-Pro aminopeptidase
MKIVDVLKKDPLKKELSFPVAEYQRRVKATQKNMKDKGIDYLIISMTPNLGYLTGYDTTMPSGYTIGILGPVRAALLNNRRYRRVLLVRSG